MFGNDGGLAYDVNLWSKINSKSLVEFEGMSLIWPKDLWRCLEWQWDLGWWGTDLRGGLECEGRPDNDLKCLERRSK